MSEKTAIALTSGFLGKLKDKHSLACGKWRLANKLGLESKEYYLGYMEAIDYAFGEAQRLLREIDPEGEANKTPID